MTEGVKEIYGVSFKDFLMRTIFKVFIEFGYHIVSVFSFGSLAVRHVGSQLPNQGCKMQPLHQKAKS